MRRAGIALASCIALVACDGDPPECESVSVKEGLDLAVGDVMQLTYRTDASLPRDYYALFVRCPTAATGALAIFHDGFGCGTDPNPHGTRSTGFKLAPAMAYVLNVRGGAEGTYGLVAEVRDGTEEGRTGDPICTIQTTVRVTDSPDAGDGAM